jgi:putative DNA-binding protein
MQLPELQRSLRTALLGEPDAQLLECIESDAISAAERLGIYRNTVAGTLEKALRLNYPAVHKLVGAGFFAQCAAGFVRLEPPGGAYLNDYGAGFAAYLAADPHAASLPYLADVARLEWAVSRALIAESPPALDLAALASVNVSQHANLCFAAHPSVSLLALETPADVIWQAALAADQAALAAIRPTGPRVQLLIERLGTDLCVRRLAPAEWAFAAALCRGTPLGAAIAAHPEADVQGQLALHLGAGRLCSWRVAAAHSLPATCL